MESGYDTIIIKKDEYEPKTMEELMADICRHEFLSAYRFYERRLFSDLGDHLNDKRLIEWIKDNASHPFEGRIIEWRENPK
jgi:hypothetical protein